jgi:regulatory protein YycI of two-component signal transduction system YycFG
MIWKGNMIWKKVKKLIIPFMFVKFLIFLFFIFGNDRVSISRDINYSSDYQTEFDNDSIVQKRTKLIRIVRNEKEPGISIKLRGKKNNNSFSEKEGEIIKPIVD